ncbi:MAG: hypothetical protein PF495_19135 [Spirochaetales bacterium]|nr:hypothetical protein [Spirochaetales bacterium]
MNILEDVDIKRNLVIRILRFKEKNKPVLLMKLESVSRFNINVGALTGQVADDDFGTGGGRRSLKDSFLPKH